ncbi:MAG: MOSC domain-containing protein [Hyphomicrobiales bacterium]|nr:MOSC domain-containing protein [Hyphomicrobiales bacterium]
MTPGRVAGLWIYPIKSMQGQALDKVEIVERGFAGDRIFAVRDEAGKFGSGKNTRRFARMEGLARWSARILDDRIEARPPDGAWLDGLGAECADKLSSQVGRPVAVAREGATPHFDAGAIHLLTTADIDALERLSGVRPQVESFRPNILIDTREESSAFLGKRIRIGVVEAQADAATERCLMVNVAPDGRKGPDFLRVLAQHTEACFGVYVSVLRAGRIALMDETHVL